MVLPRISGGGGGKFKIQGKIHPKIHLRAQRLAVLGVAAEGLGSLICLWIFRYFSSLSFAKISSSPVGLEPAARAELSRFARSCCAFSLTPSSSPAQPPKGSRLRRKPPPHRFGRERGREGREPCPCASREQKTHPSRGGSSSLEVGRQVIDDDSSTRSVGRSVSRSHRRGSLRPRSGGMSGVSVWDSVHYPAAFSRSSFGTPSRPAITQRGIS